MADFTVQNFLDMAGTKSYGILYLDEHQQLQKAETASNAITRKFQAVHVAKTGEGREVRTAFENALRGDARFQSATMQNAITRILGDNTALVKFRENGRPLERRSVKQIINRVMDEYRKKLDMALQLGFPVDEVDLLRRELSPAEADGFIKRLAASDPGDVDLIWDLGTACVDAQKRADAREKMAFMLTYCDPKHDHRAAFDKTLREKIAAKFGTFDHPWAEERLTTLLDNEFSKLALQDRLEAHPRENELVAKLRLAPDATCKDVEDANAAFAELSRRIDAAVDKIGISMKRDANVHAQIAWAADVALGDALSKVYGEDLNAYREHRASLASFMKSWVDEKFFELPWNGEPLSLGEQLDKINASAAEMASFVVSAEGASPQDRMKFLAAKIVAATFSEKDYASDESWAFLGDTSPLRKAFPSYDAFTRELAQAACARAQARLAGENKKDGGVLVDATALFVRFVREEMDKLRSEYRDKAVTVQDAFNESVKKMEALYWHNRDKGKWEYLKKYHSFNLMENPAKRVDTVLDDVIKKLAFDAYAPHIGKLGKITSKESLAINGEIEEKLNAFVTDLYELYQNLFKEVCEKILKAFCELPNVKAMPEKRKDDIESDLTEMIQDLCGQAAIRELSGMDKHDDLQPKLYHRLQEELWQINLLDVDGYLDELKDELFDLHQATKDKLNAGMESIIRQMEDGGNWKTTGAEDFRPVELFGSPQTARKLLNYHLKQLLFEQQDQLGLAEFERCGVGDSNGKVVGTVRKPQLAKAETFEGWDVARTKGEIDRCKAWLKKDTYDAFWASENDKFVKLWQSVSGAIVKLDQSVRKRIEGKLPDAALATSTSSNRSVIRKVVIRLANYLAYGQSIKIEETAKKIADRFIADYEEGVKEAFGEKKVKQFDETTGDGLLEDARNELYAKINDDRIFPGEDLSVVLADLEKALIPAANAIRAEMVANAGKVVPTREDFLSRIDKLLDEARVKYDEFRRNLAAVYGKKVEEDPKSCRDAFGPMHEYFAALIRGKGGSSAKDAVYKKMKTAVECVKAKLKDELALDRAILRNDKLYVRLTEVEDSLRTELEGRGIPGVPGFDDFLSRFETEWDFEKKGISAKAVDTFFNDAEKHLQKFHNGYATVISNVEKALVDAIGKNSNVYQEFKDKPDSATTTVLKGLLAKELSEALKSYADNPGVKYDAKPFKNILQKEIAKVQSEIAKAQSEIAQNA